MKIIGLFILFSSSIYIGILLSNKYKTKLKQLEAFLLMIKYIKAQISYFKSPLKDIYTSFQNEALEKSGFLKILRHDNWDIAISECRYRLYFDENDFEILRAFGKELGKSGKEEQVQHCEYYIHMIEQQYSKIKSELPNKTKLYKSLSFMTGITLVIILI